MTIEHAGPYVESAIFSGHRAWVAFALYNACNDDGECWPSYETIATTARCDRSTAIRQVEWLAEHGVVEVLKGDERPKDVVRQCGRANVFRVNLRFAWALGQLVRRIKDAVGRRARERNAAVALIAKWAEGVVDEHGAQTLIAAIEEIVRNEDYEALLTTLKGGAAPLLPDCNSGAAPPSRVANQAEINHLESHLAPPKPSIETSDEPSPPAAVDPPGEKEGGEDGAEAGAAHGRTGPDPGSAGRARADRARAPSGGGAAGADPSGAQAVDDGRRRDRPPDPPEHPERREARERAELAIIVQWLRIGNVDRAYASMVRKLNYDLSGEEAERYVLAIDGPMRRKAESWVRWAAQIIDGVADGTRPPRALATLVRDWRADRRGGIGRRGWRLLADGVARRAAGDGVDGGERDDVDTEGSNTDERAA